MTIRHMKIYVQVYKTKNITRAAENLHMTQPAVSRAIQELEKYYGVRLFERINHRLYETETGKLLYDHALHIVGSFDELEKGMRNWDKFGILRVGSTITLGNFMMPGIAVKFQEKYPNIRLQVTVSNGLSLQQALLDNELDAAVIEGRISFPDKLHAEVFSEDRLALVVPPKDELAAKQKIFMRDLVGRNFLMREKGSAGRTFLDGVLEVHGIAAVPVWESVSTQAIVKAVSAGLGIAFLPEKLVQKDIKDGIVASKEIEDEKFIRKNFVVWHKNKFITPVAGAFIDECKNLNFN